ncbi:MAG: PAS domain S-box protein [Thermodesulfobacteriota bacterium]
MFIWPFLHFSAFACYTLAALYVICRAPRQPLNRVCFISISCFSLWALQQTVFTLPGVPAAMARTFQYACSPSWLWFTAMLLWFSLILTEQEDILKSRWFLPAMLIPPAALTVAQMSGKMMADVHLENGSWYISWSSSDWPFAAIMVFAVHMSLSAFFLARFMKTTRSRTKKRVARIIFITVLAEVVLIAISYTVLPKLGLTSVASMASIQGVAWVTGLSYAVLRYGLMRVNPAMAADNILTAMTDILILCDMAGNVVTVNQAAAEALGCEPASLVGRKAARLFADPRPWEKIFSGSASSAPAEKRPAELAASSGEKIPVLLFSCPLKNNDGDGVGFLLSGRDLREMRKIESAFSASREKYRNILENVAEGYYEVDLDGSLTFCNRNLSEILGFPPERMNGLNYRDYTDEKTARTVFATYNRVFQTGRAEKITDYTVITKNGEERFLECSVGLSRDASGKPSGFCGMVRDVTERRRAQKEKAQLEERLHQAQKLEALGTMAGGIAHDFNNLLMGISGNLSLMLLSLEREHPFYERFTSMQRSVKTGSHLTRQLLSFAARGSFEKNACDINEIVEHTMKMVGRTQKGVALRTDLCRDCRTVEVDRTQMEQVFLNLFVNAGQAMPEGGELSVASDDVFLDEKEAGIMGIPTGNYVKVTVADTGVGMDEEVMKKAFDPFFTTKKRGRGTGLGLFSAYAIVRDHGGAIAVASKPGQGATFTVFLPATDKVLVRTQESQQELLRGKETILLVDDEVPVLLATAEMLGALGYSVITAGGGREALEHFGKNGNTVDLVILDMVMPGMNGAETCEAILAKNRGARILVISGYSARGRMDKLLSLGCSDFLQKPFDIYQLSSKVHEILARP